jgi:DNA-binding MarR family transcriptional regulator
MSSLVSELERLGLAERQVDPGDGRVVLVALTTAGRKHQDSLRRNGASVFEVLIEKLGPREAGSLRAALPALRRVLELADREPPSSRTAT